VTSFFPDLIVGANLVNKKTALGNRERSLLLRIS
jgi:hypothetical protein